MKRLFYIILIISISVSSCQFEREVETNIKPIEPHLVLNSLLFAERDSSFFYLTKSRSAFYETDTTWWDMQKKDFEYIGDAKFQLQVNGTTFNLKYIIIIFRYSETNTLEMNLMNRLSFLIILRGALVY